MSKDDVPKFEETIIPAKGIRSLVWHGDHLVDWVAGGKGFSLSGEVTSSRYSYGFPFDAAVASSDSQYAVIYTKLGTKGIVTHHGKIIREINRSYYCADAYEYPVTIFRLKNGREILAHCPNEYCRLEFEDLVTGELLTAKISREPADFFHSRLAASSDGGYLLSAGWGWHPIDVVKVFHIETALNDASHLDGDGLFSDDWADESGAAFLGDDRLIVALADVVENGKPPQLRMHTLDKTAPSRVIETDARVGTVMPVGEKHLINFHENPKLIDWQTGAIVKMWPHIASGSQFSPIIHGIEPVPPMALDPVRQRVAIADEEKITVLTFK